MIGTARLTLKLLLVASGCGISSIAQPQEAARPATRPPAVMDERTRELHFGAQSRAPKKEARVAITAEDLADNLDELRIYLTDTENSVIGELVTGGRTQLTSFSAAFEGDNVRFLDDGKAPDQKRGDGVFTATFSMDTAAAFGRQQAALKGFTDAQSGKGKSTYVRRGPRDIVPAKQVLPGLQTRNAVGLPNQKARTAAVLKAKDPRVLAQQLKLDLRATPFLRIPVERLDARQLQRPLWLFEIPMFPPFPFPPLPVPIDEFKSLMVINPSVVDDPARTYDACTNTGNPAGAWTFGHLVREMAEATSLTPEEFLQDWLATWSSPQEANNWIVSEPGRGAKLHDTVIDTWRQLSGNSLDVDKFPARLMAIVNRPDLADKIGYGTAGSAGEGRFVFGLVRKDGTNCRTMQFTVIFEYGIKGGSCGAVKAWHRKWKDLDKPNIDYNLELEAITRAFTESGVNPAQLPNLSALNQLRTNEIALFPIWQLREFQLQDRTGSGPLGTLDLVTVKQTPDDSFNRTPPVTFYLENRFPDIIADRQIVPERFLGPLNPFRGAKSNAPNEHFFWDTDVTQIPDHLIEARRKFSLGTCNGCHTGETGTFFTHIGGTGTRELGSPASLSRFLTGIDVPDPSGHRHSSGTLFVHHYEDLAERELKLSNILTQSCFQLLAERRIPFVH